jgi:hypothetical protein
VYESAEADESSSPTGAAEYTNDRGQQMRERAEGARPWLQLLDSNQRPGG